MNTVPQAETAQAVLGAGPLRTCVGCRQIVRQKSLVRVTLTGGSVADRSLLVDGKTRNPGRGAYVHAQESCVSSAVRGGMSRSFRTSIPRDAFAEIQQCIPVGDKKSTFASISDVKKSEGSDE